MGARLLLEAMGGGAPDSVIIAPDLVIRGSTAWADMRTA